MGYGELSYSHWNLGDNIQTLAARQLLAPIVPALTLDRDTHELSSPTFQHVRVLFNGWVSAHHSKFPPLSNIEPLFIGFHWNEQLHPSLPSFAFQSIASHIDYLKAHSPIGCRDTHTLQLLKSHNVPSYFSGCPTLTLEPDYSISTRDKTEILLVDLTPAMMAKLPLSIRTQGVQLTHILPKGLTHAVKMERASQMINRYRRAKFVITSRLHAALPCRAMNVPCVMMIEDTQDVRWGGLIDFLTTCGPSDPWNVDIDHFAYPLDSKLSQLQNDIRETVWKWVHQSGFPLSISPGRSIVTACMKREDHLEMSIGSWLATFPSEVIIVSWGSSERLKGLIAKYPKHNIRIIEVPNVTQWIASHAFNLAMRFARYDSVAKVDCDTILDPTFYHYHHLQEGVFFAGNWRKAKDVNGHHLNGVFYANQKDLNHVNWMSEFILKYGWDDDDLYTRLVQSGLLRLDARMDLLQHIPHEGRLDNQSNDSPVAQSIQENRKLSLSSPWTKHSPLSTFRFLKTSPNHVVCEWIWSASIPKNPPTLPPETKVPHSPCIPPPPSKLVFALQPINGLGNRMRAFASAYNIARAMNRILTVHWVLDIHCEAKFTDLYNVPPFVIIREDALPIGVPVVAEDATTSYVLDGLENVDIFIASAKVFKSKHTNWLKESIVLKSLQLNADMNKRVEDLKCSHDFQKLVGVHIRMGQDPTLYPFDNVSYYHTEIRMALEKWRTASHWKNFAKEMRKMVTHNPQQRFFVCADNNDAIEALRREFSENKIISIPRTVFDRSVQQVQWALVEIYGLSFCPLLLGSEWSTFTEMAHRLAPCSQVMKLSGKDF